MRTFEGTIASTRVFNESRAALLAILDDIVRHGNRDVVLIGDYSDDGQLHPGAVYYGTAAMFRVPRPRAGRERSG